MKLFSILFYIILCLQGSIRAQDNFDSEIGNFICETLYQEDIRKKIEIFDTGPDSKSLACTVFQFGTEGTRFKLGVDLENFKLLSRAEQYCIILHEIGHLKASPYKAILYQYTPQIIDLTLSMYILIKRPYQSQPQLWKNTFKNIALAFTSGFIAKVISILYFKRLLRQDESAADAYAFAITQDISAMKSALEKQKQIFEKEPISWWDRLFAGHPSDEERIASLINKY